MVLRGLVHTVIFVALLIHVVITHTDENSKFEDFEEPVPSVDELVEVIWPKGRSQAHYDFAVEAAEICGYYLSITLNVRLQCRASIVFQVPGDEKSDDEYHRLDIRDCLDSLLDWPRDGWQVPYLVVFENENQRPPPSLYDEKLHLLPAYQRRVSPEENDEAVRALLKEGTPRILLTVIRFFRIPSKYLTDATIMDKWVRYLFNSMITNDRFPHFL